jgi:acetylornithine deacetylase/succinyl-diaminopimelate desuccinylase-like protein
MPKNKRIYKQPVEILQKLIQFDTTNPPGRTVECIEYINCLLQEVGFKTQVLGKDQERLNLVTRLRGRGEAPPLLLYGHVDVVPVEGQTWQYPPFEGVVADGCVWGRGAMDMKGGMTMLLSALLIAKVEGFHPPGDLVFVALADEEIGGEFGAEFLVQEHPFFFDDISYALGEAGGYNLELLGTKFYPIQIAEKQGCGVELRAYGPGGHGSLVYQGTAMGTIGKVLKRLDENLLPVHITPALRLMVEAMAGAVAGPAKDILFKLLDVALADVAIEELGDLGVILFPPLIRNTFNPTIVRGGHAVNVIPSEIMLNCDMRLLPGFTAEDGLQEVQDVIQEDVELKVVYYSPNNAQPNMGLFDTLAGILKDLDPDGVPIPYFLSGVTDARFFAQLGIQTYGFLPMQFPKGQVFMQTAHSANERIPIAALDFGIDAIYKVFQRFHA